MSESTATFSTGAEGKLKSGRIVQIIGPTLDVEFEEGHLPEIFAALEVFNPSSNMVIVSEVAQHLGNNVVRAISMTSTDGLVRGMNVTSTGKPISVPVGK